MASIVKRTLKDGRPAHYVKFAGGDGRQHWERVPGGMKEARHRKAQIEVELAKTGGRWVPPTAVKFETFALGWLESYARPALRRRVYDHYERAVRLDLLPRFGKLELAAITRMQVKEMVAEKLATGLAPNTVRNTLAPLRTLLAHAVDDGLLTVNPAAGVRIPQTTRTRRIIPPSREQVLAVIEHARPEARDAIIVAAATGLRRGELFGLVWKDVNFDAGTIHVHATNYAGIVEQSTKTEAGERHVPLFASARRALAARKLRSPFARDDDFVFASKIGTPAEPNSFVRRQFNPALERAGLPHFRWHALRHYAVSELIAGGADIKLIQSVAGHASAVMTLDVYGHLMVARVSEAAAKYDPLGLVATGG